MGRCSFNVKTISDKLEAINKTLKYSYSKLSYFSIFLFILGCIIIFCLSKIIEILTFYYQQQKAQRDMQKKNSANIYMDSKNDDIVGNNIKKAVTDEDDYETISTNITNSVAAYQELNNKLETYYKDKNKSTPDIIDKHVIDSNFDNYK